MGEVASSNLVVPTIFLNEPIQRLNWGGVHSVLDGTQPCVPPIVLGRYLIPTLILYISLVGFGDTGILAVVGGLRMRIVFVSELILVDACSARFGRDSERT